MCVFSYLCLTSEMFRLFVQTVTILLTPTVLHQQRGGGGGGGGGFVCFERLLCGRAKCSSKKKVRGSSSRLWSSSEGPELKANFIFLRSLPVCLFLSLCSVHSFRFHSIIFFFFARQSQQSQCSSLCFHPTSNTRGSFDIWIINEDSFLSFFLSGNNVNCFCVNKSMKLHLEASIGPNMLCADTSGKNDGTQALLRVRKQSMTIVTFTGCEPATAMWTVNQLYMGLIVIY